MKNMPKGNVWELTDKDDKSLYYGRTMRFNFTMFKAEKIRQLIKIYVWKNYTTGAASISSLRSHCSNFRYFSVFAEVVNALVRLR